MQMLDSANCFVHVHGLPLFIIVVVMAGILAVQRDVLQLNGALCHGQRTEQGQCLADNGKQKKKRAKSAWYGVRSYPVLRQDCAKRVLGALCVLPVSSVFSMRCQNQAERRFHFLTKSFHPDQPKPQCRMWSSHPAGVKLSRNIKWTPDL
jgi:hypothetical protein